MAEHELADKTRSIALQGRAWAYFKQEQNKLAVRDMEEAFKLTPPSTYHQYIKYSAYLRSVGRYQDSLRAIRSAEAFDTKEGEMSMMTQYNMGWTLHMLGRHRESVEAYTRGISAQPKFPFAYWRRGLVLDAMGKKQEAKKDFEEFLRRMSKEEIEVPKIWQQEIKAKFKEYNIRAKIPL